VKEWNGSPDPADPDNFWIDDATGERVNATTGERIKPMNMKYVFKIAKTIVVEVEALSLEAAQSKAYEYDEQGADGLWDAAEATLELIATEVS
jgi:hypothetical protein